MKRIESAQIELQIAPLIDVCFLLLFFFMATAVPNKKEGQVEIPIPHAGSTDEVFPPIEEQHLKILDNGQVLWNEAQVDGPDSAELPSLSEGLKRLKAISERSSSTVPVIIEAGDKSPYQRFIDVIVACQKSGITAVTLSSEDTDSL